MVVTDPETLFKMIFLTPVLHFIVENMGVIRNLDWEKQKSHTDEKWWISKLIKARYVY